MTTPVFPLVPTTQQYAWGKLGRSSRVAQFAEAAGVPGLSLDERIPYAELWMGTHRSSPSHLLDGTPLSEHLASNPSLIGDDIIMNFDAANGDIPFLFKVLAIEKALSIQTHPDRQFAEKLHAKHPDMYKDANHKPEMAIALSQFSALLGFRPLPQIAAFITSTPEFASLIPSTVLSHFLSVSNSRTPTGPNEKAALRDLFSYLTIADESKFKHELAKLVARYRAGKEKPEERDVKELVLHLESQYPGDIGVFCVFVLNHATLQPGEAIFLGAGEPHAYISGDIIETMATSDNVIRAGLTPKPRDVPNLLEGLTYTAADMSKHMVKPRAVGSDDETLLYDPPVPEFSVARVKARHGAFVRQGPLRGPSIFIVTKGSGYIHWQGQGGDKGEKLSLGRVFFIGARTPVSFEASESLEVYRAFVEPKAPRY